jgi:hypothetical protein
MDIEGYEFPWIRSEGDILANVGQFLVEVHVKRENSLRFKVLQEMGLTKLKVNAVDFVEMAERSGLRLFMKEPNVLNSHRCSEFAFVQKAFTTWDREKGNLNVPVL